MNSTLGFLSKGKRVSEIDALEIKDRFDRVLGNGKQKEYVRPNPIKSVKSMHPRVRAFIKS